MSFRNRTHENNKEVSKYIWGLKDEKKYFDIKWSILKKPSEYCIVSKSCNLFFLEKLVICHFKEKDSLLNNRLDLVSKCSCENKYTLMNYSARDYNYNYNLTVIVICNVICKLFMYFIFLFYL